VLARRRLPVLVDRRAGGPPEEAVPHEELVRAHLIGPAHTVREGTRAAGPTRHEVARPAVEGDVAAIGREAGTAGQAVAHLGAAVHEVHALGRLLARPALVEDAVAVRIAVVHVGAAAWHELAPLGREADQAPGAGDARPPR